MDSVSVSHKWNDDPDYESFARSMLDLLLEFEDNGVLAEMLADAEAEAAGSQDGEAA